MSRKKAVVRNMEYMDYVKDLSKEEKVWIEQFYAEYYANGSYSAEEPLLTSKTQLRDARKMNNSLYRDALNVGLNQQNLMELPAAERELINEATDEMEWEDAYAQAGPQWATELIFKQAVRSLDDGLKPETVLARFYVKMEKLRKQILKEKRNEKA
jgi:hypothetical protein